MSSRPITDFPHAKPGVRVEAPSGDRGTIMWIGSPHVSPNKTWIGVVWDLGSKLGKHDGTVDGTKYFQVPPVTVTVPTRTALEGHTPSITEEHLALPRASLVNPEKVLYGHGLFQVLSAKYNPAPDQSAAVTSKDPELYITSVRARKVPVELVGMEKVEGVQKELKALVEAHLSFERVAWFLDEAVEEDKKENVQDDSGCCDTDASPAKSAAGLKSLEVLDLSKTMLSSWEDVLKGVAMLPNLKWLRVSLNTFYPPLSHSLVESIPKDVLSSGIGSLSIFVANEVQGLTWEQVAVIGDIATNLNQLHLCGNGLKDPKPDVLNKGALSKLVLLNLEDNHLESWDALSAAFGALPDLAHLNVNANPLKAVTHQPESVWPALASLSLSRTDISSWASINAIHFMPNLMDLRFQWCPLTATLGAGAARQSVIARVGKLAQFNGSSVRERERSDAEKAYVRQMAIEMTRVHAARAVNGMSGEGAAAGLVPLEDRPRPEGWDNDHPRFEALLREHGEPALGGGGVEGTGSLANTAVSVSIVSHLAASCTRPALTKKLPGTMQISALKMLVSRLFSADVEEISLFYKDGEGDTAFPEALDNDDETLRFYGVRPGSTILVEELDRTAAARANEAAAKELADAMAAQEARAAESGSLKAAETSAGIAASTAAAQARLGTAL